MKGFFFIYVNILFVVNALTDQEKWTNFKIQFEKNYDTFEEEEKRFEIFQNNLNLIKEHNAKYEAGLSTYALGINRFADMNADDLQKSIKRQKNIMKYEVKEISIDIKDIPDNFDWRNENISNTVVRDQGSCLHSSWAFSAVGALEAQNDILNQNAEFLSVQQLIDCSKVFGNEGCTNGSPISAFQYVEFNGLATEDAYPYNGINGTCKTPEKSGIEVTGYRTVSSTEAALKAAVATIGPISARIYVSPVLLYENGVFESYDCINDLDSLDYSVLVVGYDTEPATDSAQAIDYWSLKMFWGDGWGENGYLRLARGKSQCGIALDTSYPSINVTGI